MASVPITKTQEDIIDLHERLIKNFYKATKPEIGYYEGQFQCAVLIKLMIHDIEAICILAKKDLLYLPTAILISRRIFEVWVTISWILKPEDPFEQEARWLRLIHHSKNTESKFFTECLQQAQEKGLDDKKLLDHCQGIDDFYSSVESLLEEKFPKKYDHSNKPPSMREMLKDIKREEYYLLYKFGSHYAHGSMIGTEYFRRGHGVSKKIGVFISPDDWDICFKTTMMSFLQTGITFLEHTGGNVNLFIPQNLKVKIEDIVGLKFHL